MPKAPGRPADYGRQILRHLCLCGGRARQSDVCEVIGIDAGRLGALVAGLVHNGYVRRETTENGVEVALTELGSRWAVSQGIRVSGETQESPLAAPDAAAAPAPVREPTTVGTALLSSPSRPLPVRREAGWLDPPRQGSAPTPSPQKAGSPSLRAQHLRRDFSRPEACRSDPFRREPPRREDSRPEMTRQTPSQRESSRAGVSWPSSAVPPESSRQPPPHREVPPRPDLVHQAAPSPLPQTPSLPLPTPIPTPIPTPMPMPMPTPAATEGTPEKPVRQSRRLPAQRKNEETKTDEKQADAAAAAGHDITVDENGFVTHINGKCIF
ncbi:MAG: hypothetical protein ABT940_09885 [Alphaproteobacteria bacterium]